MKKLIHGQNVLFSGPQEDAEPVPEEAAAANSNGGVFFLFPAMSSDAYDDGKSLTVGRSHVKLISVSLISGCVTRSGRTSTLTG